MGQGTDYAPLFLGIPGYPVSLFAVLFGHEARRGVNPKLGADATVRPGDPEKDGISNLNFIPIARNVPGDRRIRISQSFFKP
jgi:hypothetical protein